jgi:hypothetical protein
VIVLEYQRARHPLWYALAARALDPMLGRLRALERGVPDVARTRRCTSHSPRRSAACALPRADGPPFPLLTLRRTLERALFKMAADGARERCEADTLSNPKMAFAFRYLAAHFGLGLVTEEEACSVLDHVAGHLRQLARQIRHARRGPVPTGSER